MTHDEANANIKAVTEYARSLGFRGVIVAANIGDQDATWWRAEYRGPAFDVEALARRLHNFTTRIVRSTEMQTDVLLDQAQRAVALDTPVDPAAQSTDPAQPPGEGASP